MKNKINIWFLVIFLILINIEVKSQEEFNFDVTEIEILDNGNKFIGKKKGKITSNNGVIIEADQFEYNKLLNLLNANGNVIVHDQLNDYYIYSEKIIYDKNKDLIISEDKSKALSVKDNIQITAKRFKYNQKLNIISAYQNVFIENKKKNYQLRADNVKYSIRDSKFFSDGNSEFLNLNDQTLIRSERLVYDISKNIINANKNVVLENKNKNKNYKILSDEITYYKNIQKITTKGKTFAEIDSKYQINSRDVLFFQKTMELSSNEKTLIKDKFNIYNTSKFKYFIDEEFLKAEKITIVSNYQKPQNDKYYFKSGMINLKNQDYIAGNTKINIHKDIFDNTKNDPRIIGVSSKKNGDITIINKGVFTSCKINGDCPPWAIEASEIKHDKKKQEVFYKNAILKIYNIPVFYFPKFFHPDPTVKRRSGILKPVINESSVLGSSLTIPYYHVLSEESDLTVTPTIFDTDSNMLQNEFRKITKNSDILVNFGHVRDYKSASQNKTKNTSYVFSNVNYDLTLDGFISSKLNFNFEKVTNDSFLKVFDTNLNEYTTRLKPESNTLLKSELIINLNHENYNFKTGFASYENLQKDKNDRYQYILPYYDFNKTILLDEITGSFNFNSNGSNDLNNTNQLTTKITNNLTYSSLDYFTNSGFKNNFNINLKNLNSVGKNVSNYKTSPQMELSSLFEFNSSMPLKKKDGNNSSLLSPKMSMRFNPGNMKNHKNSDKNINIGNIFSVDRLGLGDSYESGKSITLGLDYKKNINKKSNETLKEINKYFELKLATVFRDKEENFIPTKTTLNKKTSNIFGSMSTDVFDNIKFNYNFAINNNLDDIEYNDLNTTIFFNNFSSVFSFVKSSNEMGDENFLKNTTSYKFDDNNFIKFNTRRNRKINLTEFYDLVYEYRNDCLVAGIKYKKTYYEDRDLKPNEDLLFSVTFIPLTKYEQKVN